MWASRGDVQMFGMLNPESGEASGVNSYIRVLAVGDGASGKVSFSSSSATKLR